MEIKLTSQVVRALLKGIVDVVDDAKKLPQTVWANRGPGIGGITIGLVSVAVVLVLLSPGLLIRAIALRVL